MNPVSLLGRLNRAPGWLPSVRVWGLTLKPPTFDRWLYLQLHRFGRMGRAEQQLFSSLVQPGMQVVDIGANIGLYALLLARLVGPSGRVSAFEPDALMASALRRNTEANPPAAVALYPFAAGASASSGYLHAGSFNSGDNRLWSDAPASAASSGQPVAIVALDDVLAGQRIDFIKIDVQGWETQALQGLGGLVRSNPALIIYLEFWPQGLRATGSSPAQLEALLSGYGLRLTLVQPGLDKPVPDLEGLAATMKPNAYCNLLARRP